MVVAIDGYSSCGKSTLAKALAKALGYVFVDTGAMYRAVTLYVLDEGVALEDEGAVRSALGRISIGFEHSGGEQKTFLNGVDVSDEIRSARVADKVSDVARIADVRSALVKQQQALAEDANLVMDGRDIGTVVFPEAEVKFFVTADVEERVRRRYTELIAKGKQTSMQEVEENLKKRDRIDSTRAVAPLRRADDAFLIDNTYLNQDEQLALALEVISRAVEA